MFKLLAHRVILEALWCVVLIGGGTNGLKWGSSH